MGAQIEIGAPIEKIDTHWRALIGKIESLQIYQYGIDNGFKLQLYLRAMGHVRSIFI